jgi:hypothetical protein
VQAAIPPLVYRLPWRGGASERNRQPESLPVGHPVTEKL